MGFTDTQNKAIDMRNKTILVSAAAGSGKTTTLTERIIRLLTDCQNPADIGRFLIVTFTNASAADLRAKITSAVSKALAADPANAHLNRQLLKLGSAHICTMDSFYLDVVKENFQSLGIGASVRIIDPNQREILMTEIMSALVSARYEESSDFADAMDCFMDSRGSSKVEEELIALYTKLSGYPEFIEFLKTDGEMLEKEAKAIRSFCLDFFNYARPVLNSLCDEAETEFPSYSPSISFDRDHMTNTYDAIAQGDYNRAYDLFSSYANVGRARVKKKSVESVAFANKQDTIRNDYERLRNKFFSQSEESCRLLLERNALFCRETYSLLCEFHRLFSEKKRSMGVLDFEDNKRMSLRLFVDKDLNPTEYAKEFSRRFDAIYIDEYQDTDMVQDTIFRAISRSDNRFMVGDIKQSIYRFRGANPTVFAGYKNSFPDADEATGDECAIYMSENFRCDDGVINLTNAVSGFVFEKGLNKAST